MQVGNASHQKSGEIIVSSVVRPDWKVSEMPWFEKCYELVGKNRDKTVPW
jgi:hypothetical protein